MTASELVAARYDRAARRYGRLLVGVERRIAYVATLRFVAFVVAAVFGFAALKDGEPVVYGLPALAGAATFLVAVWLHRGPYTLAPRVRALVTTATENAARLRAQWDAVPDDGAEFLDPARPELSELQVFGRGSLYHLMTRATLPDGRARLAALLTDGIAPSTCAERQAAARELARLSGLRHRFHAEGRMVEVDEGALRDFLAWAEAPPARAWLANAVWPVRLLVVATWAQVVASAAFDLETQWKACLVAQLGIFLVTSGPLAKGYLHLLGRRGHRPFVALRRMFALVERRSFEAPLLQAARAALSASGVTPSSRLKVLEDTVEALAVRESALTHTAVNVGFLWELQQCDKLERWRLRHGAGVRADLAAIADLEALCSVAGFAADHRAYAWPTLHEADAAPPFDAEGLGHPLFPDAGRRTNDYRVETGGVMTLVTGSNMSGKSSFLRTLGVAVHLAQAGAPVCATRLSLRACRLSTSIQVTDAPGEGLSRFYAEVKRIAAVLAAVEDAERDAARRPRLYLVDEMLSGTNSRERHMACREIVGRLVAASRSHGLVTTHDLELVGVADMLPEAIRLAHFSDRFDGDALHFDYQLREGTATTTNALHVLRMEGIDVPEGA